MQAEQNLTATAPERRQPKPGSGWFMDLCACLAVATLLFGGHIRAYLDPKVRFLKFWDVPEAIGFFLAIVLLALCFWIAQWLLRFHLPYGRAGQLVAKISFAILFLQGMMVSIRPPATTFSVWSPLLTGLVWLFLAGILAFRLVCRDGRCIQFLYHGAVLLSPLLPISAFQLWPTDKNSAQPAVAPVDKPLAFPILLVVFDGWSYERSFQGNKVLPALTNLQSFASNAFIFHNARSAGEETFLAIPRMLYGTTGDPSVGKTGFAWANLQDLRLPPKSLFELVQPEQTQVLGFYLPYQQMLGKTVGTARSYPVSPKAGIGSFWFHYLDVLVYWQDAWTEAIRKRWYFPDTDKPKCILGPYWWKLSQDLRNDAREALRSGRNQLFYFHFSVPHPPFVFSESGRYQLPEVENYHYLPGYLRNLQEMDRALGDVIGELQSRKDYDRALVILTGDHSWRGDYTRGGRIKNYQEKVTHVPLLVKWPNQQERVELNRPFALLDIRTLIESALMGQSGKDAVISPRAFSARDSDPAPAKESNRQL